MFVYVRVGLIVLEQIPEILSIRNTKILLEKAIFKENIKYAIYSNICC